MWVKADHVTWVHSPSSTEHSANKVKNPTAFKLWEYLGSEYIFLKGILFARNDLTPYERKGITRQQIQSTDTYNALDVFIETAYLRCSQPQDRVYGLLGILADIDVGECVVDYQLSLTQVYAQFINMFMKKYQSLLFICYFPRRQTSSSIPSWIPAPEREPDFPYRDIEVSRASGKIAASNARISQDGLAITVRGLLLDRVTEINPGGTLHSTPISAWTSALEYFCRQIQTSEENPPWLDSQVLDLIFPPWGDKFYQAHAGRTQPYGIEEKRSILNDLVQMNNTRDCSSLSLEDIFYGNGTISKTMSQSRKSSFWLVRLAILRRILFATESKRVGLAVGLELQPKDEIWVLFGCPLPLVLRPRPDKGGGYMYVASARATGLMDGKVCEKILGTGKTEADYKGPPVCTLTIW
ncbi:hypothetical protein DM02DRAFT_651980 [Periconia macrospinosa]|uniref:Heterokaryon incompatibility domain-containing protein n=1 Tax=Periconia macrospinosa TaxID=97972 RepID=A0A2V1E073_9PLEO|nr:hypothetical protein DM02DRAFT_651980 [Periconia macrospinosa]